jgi:hypothetical protein
MLFNAQNQVVSLTTNQIKVCNDGKKFAERQDEGLPINKKMNITIEARKRILKPLIERKQHPNPNGRGLEGAFSLGTRVRFIQ